MQAIVGLRAYIHRRQQFLCLLSGNADLFCRIVLFNIPPIIIMTAMSGTIALTVLAYFSSIKCDPLANKDIADSNMVRQLLVLFIALIIILYLCRRKRLCSYLPFHAIFCVSLLL